MSQKRSIFAEVADDGGKPVAPQGGMIDSAKQGARKAIRSWLSILLLLVIVMVLVGGLTRLTDSGLSITEWKPVTGSVPPMSAEAWDSEFAKYQATPEFQLQNSEMTVSEFKSIYWWEWAHRQLGRVIGLVWAVGFLWFLLRRKIPTGWTGRLLGIGVLIGLQGAVGWWMVASGLTGRMVDVASYRLATHLGLAFVILGLISWYMFSLKSEARDLMLARRSREAGLQMGAMILSAMVFVQIVLGALVAGIDAGRGFPTWPSMNGAFLPSESFDYTPMWTNVFENPALVQFDHRMLGYIVFLLAGFLWWRSRKSPNRATKTSFDVVMILVAAQMLLGIGTVLMLAQWHIAIVHQFGAMALFVMSLRAGFAAQYPAAQSLR